MIKQYTPKKADAEKAIHLFKEAEEEFQKALDELERVYYLMDDHDADIGYVTGYLEQYGRLPTDECEIEEKLVREYEFAKNANASASELDEIYNKIKVINRIYFNNSKSGILYAILRDDGKL